MLKHLSIHKLSFPKSGKQSFFINSPSIVSRGIAAKPPTNLLRWSVNQNKLDQPLNTQKISKLSYRAPMMFGRQAKFLSFFWGVGGNPTNVQSRNCRNTPEVPMATLRSTRGFFLSTNISDDSERSVRSLPKINGIKTSKKKRCVFFTIMLIPHFEGDGLVNHHQGTKASTPPRSAPLVAFLPRF